MQHILVYSDSHRALSRSPETALSLVSADQGL